MDTLTAVAIAALGVAVAETAEALRLFLTGGVGDETHMWPSELPISRYLIASAIRLSLGLLVVVSLSMLGLLCNETLAFLAGLSTLKVMEVLFGLTPAAWSPQGGSSPR